MATLDPYAPAPSDHDDNRPEAEAMIREYVTTTGALRPHSAAPFAAWLAKAWWEFAAGGDQTNEVLIEAALDSWRHA